MKKLLFIVLALAGSRCPAQPAVKVYPTNWWVGMKNPRLQLMLHGEGVGKGRLRLQSYPGVTLVKTHPVSNPNYLFADLLIGKNAAPGILHFTISRPGQASRSLPYTLGRLDPADGKTRILGIRSADLIYLIMPDRFSDGDTTNDRIPGMRDQGLDRNDIFKRHGGDLEGIDHHLDYLQDLGVTALWLNPVLENDMPDRTEHGYAITDHYTIEPRLGGAKAYHRLISDLHARGMKIIQDAVYNHMGIEHFLYRDLPDSSFFHFWPQYTNTSYKDQVLMDPHAAAIDKKIMSDGWFVPSMPDVNEHNPYMARFLIQNALWCTEEFGIDGWRIDTYAYNDLDFMNRCNQALLDQFPQLHIFGETFVHGVINQSFFTRNLYEIPYKSNLPGATDFQLNFYGIVPALTQPYGWTEGINQLYATTARDFVYKDPMKNVIFLDNHDISRFYSVVGEDPEKLKMGLAWLLTFRGIPELYYGTEVGMKGLANPDGNVRLDFPGGWPGDPVNKFEAGGRTSVENGIYNYVRTLARFRRSSPALTRGKLMQYVPEDSVYVYFRYDKKQTVLCAMNPNDKAVTIAMARFSERLHGFTRMREVLSGAGQPITDSLRLPAKTELVLELER